MNALPLPAAVMPHKAPMILIDELVESTGASLTARVRLRDDSPFVEGGRVSSVIAIEYMAQAIAAMAGLRRLGRGQEVRAGFLLACRELVLEVPEFRAGDELFVEARESWSTDELGHFQCTVLREGKPVATGSLSVYQGELKDTP